MSEAIFPNRIPNAPEAKMYEIWCRLHGKFYSLFMPVPSSKGWQWLGEPHVGLCPKCNPHLAAGHP